MLEIEGLRKVYRREGQPDHEALRDLTFSIARGEFLSIVGPSGCGKSTLLSCIAGLRAATGGRVMLSGQPVTAPPKAMVLIFQEYGRTLLPWRTAINNVIFGMENRSEIPAAEYRTRAMDALRRVGLQAQAHSYPWQMSGGQQQRVAIARGLANGADILLLDEPFASVDAQTRIELEDLLLEIWAETARTILFVTHDIDEAVYLSDRVLVLSPPPCTITAALTIDLDRPRQQLATREMPRYLEYRREIHGLLHAGRHAPTA